MLEQKVTQVRSMGFDEVISATSFCFYHLLCPCNEMKARHLPVVFLLSEHLYVCSDILVGTICGSTVIQW